MFGYGRRFLLLVTYQWSICPVDACMKTKKHTLASGNHVASMELRSRDKTTSNCMNRAGVKPKLTDRSIRYAIRQLKKGWGAEVVAEELNVTQRCIQRLWAEYRKTGTIHR